MEIICAGFPKTGTKSCSSALRKLGYNVADTMENIQFLMAIWRDYVTGQCSIEDVLASRLLIIRNVFL